MRHSNHFQIRYLLPFLMLICITAGQAFGQTPPTTDLSNSQAASGL